MKPNHSRRSLRALDATNFFLADVRDGIGPYLAIFLLASHKWDAASIGIAMSAMGVATLIAQTPAGALIDRTRYKRLIIAGSAIAIALACSSMTIFVNLPAIIAAQAICGVAAALIGPGVASITLGLVGRAALPKRTGRNEAFNHGGNVVAAILAGLVGHYIHREWIFYLVGGMALLSLVSILCIRETDIDHQKAKGCEGTELESNDQESFGDLLKDRRTLAFVGSMMLFHFANAAMLPLVGQLMSEGKQTGASLYMSACIVAAQVVMIPVAIWAGKYSETWGRRPVMLVALLVLPIRGVLYTLSSDPFYLVGVQMLDGVAAGIFGVTSVLIVADLTKGTGRYNLALGALSTSVGVGASLSTAVAGFVVAYHGYSSAFLFLGAIAAVAALVFWYLVPETRSARR